MHLLQIGLASTLWCFFHSFFVSHTWRDFLRRKLPRHHAFGRIFYVAFSSLTLLFLMLWMRKLPQSMIWDWPGWWTWLRWAGLLLSGFIVFLGARSFDNRAFLGLRQVADFFRGVNHEDPPFKTRGILGIIRHPWYLGTFLFLVFCLPVTDVNLVWRVVFFGYTVVGTELEERKLVKDLGVVYEDYRKRVPRFLPWV